MIFFCYNINLIFSFWCLEHIDVGLVTKILCVLELIEILGCADFSHVQEHNCTLFFAYWPLSSTMKLSSKGGDQAKR